MLGPCPAQGTPHMFILASLTPMLCIPQLDAPHQVVGAKSKNLAGLRGKLPTWINLPSSITVSGASGRSPTAAAREVLGRRAGSSCTLLLCCAAGPHLLRRGPAAQKAAAGTWCGACPASHNPCSEPLWRFSFNLMDGHPDPVKPCFVLPCTQVPFSTFEEVLKRKENKQVSMGIACRGRTCCGRAQGA